MMTWSFFTFDEREVRHGAILLECTGRTRACINVGGIDDLGSALGWKEPEVVL